jgi:hypothetical protein
MVPYKRNPPPLIARLFLATMLAAMGPVYWFLQRFKLDGKLFASMRARQRKELQTRILSRVTSPPNTTSS